jgi:hypothetical protein
MKSELLWVGSRISTAKPTASDCRYRRTPSNLRCFTSALICGVALLFSARADFQWTGSWFNQQLAAGPATVVGGPDFADGGVLSGWAAAEQHALLGPPPSLWGDPEAGTVSQRSFLLTGPTDWRLDFRIEMNGTAWGRRGFGSVNLDIAVYGTYLPPSDSLVAHVGYYRESRYPLVETNDEDFTESFFVPSGTYVLSIVHRVKGVVWAPQDFWDNITFGEANDSFKVTLKATPLPIPEPATWAPASSLAVLMALTITANYLKTRRR